MPNVTVSLKKEITAKLMAYLNQNLKEHFPGNYTFLYSEGRSEVDIIGLPTGAHESGVKLEVMYWVGYFVAQAEMTGNV